MCQAAPRFCYHCVTTGPLVKGAEWQRKAVMAQPRCAIRAPSECVLYLHRSCLMCPSNLSSFASSYRQVMHSTARGGLHTYKAKQFDRTCCNDCQGQPHGIPTIGAAALESGRPIGEGLPQSSSATCDRTTASARMCFSMPARSQTTGPARILSGGMPLTMQDILDGVISSAVTSTSLGFACEDDLIVSVERPAVITRADCVTSLFNRDQPSEVVLSNCLRNVYGGGLSWQTSRKLAVCLQSCHKETRP